MRVLILSAALVALSGWTTVEAQGLRNTLTRCAAAAGPAGMTDLERVEMLTLITPAQLGNEPKGTPFLTFEVRNPDGGQWEVICNGETGAVLDVEREVPSADDPLFRRLAKVTEPVARKAALAAQPGEILAVEYEVSSDGTPTYEFEVKPASGQAGRLVEVSAVSGKVTKIWAQGYVVASQ